MVKLIIGLKGSGKTKALVGLVCKAVDEDTGDVICIEKDRKLTYDIPYKARLIDAVSYDIGSYEFLKGFISGIHAGNYDITHFFIDNFFKLVDDKSEGSLVGFIQWLAAYSDKENIRIRHQHLDGSRDCTRRAEAVHDINNNRLAANHGEPVCLCKAIR